MIIKEAVPVVSGNTILKQLQPISAKTVPGNPDLGFQRPRSSKLQNVSDSRFKKSPQSPTDSNKSSSWNRRQEKVVSPSRPCTASTVRSISYTRDRRNSQKLSSSRKCSLSRPVSRFSDYSVDSLISSRTKRPGSASTLQSCSCSSTRRPDWTGHDTNERRYMTSKDAMVRLFDVWQPQLTSSYRCSVDYIPTGPLQMKAFMNAMLMDKQPSPYLEKFRTVGRLIETVNHFNHLPSLDSSSGVSSVSVERQDSVASSGSVADSRLLELRHPRRPKSGSLPCENRSNDNFGVHAIGKLEKSKSHAQFKL